MSASRSASRYRLFFALMPPPAVAAQIGARARALGASRRLIAGNRLHLTLAFLGTVDTQQRQQALSAGDEITAPAFTLRIDRAGSFRRAGVSWLAPSTPSAALPALAARLYENTRSALDKRRFRPQVSIARGGAPLQNQAITPITWTVAEFCLIESGAAGAPAAYCIVRRWPLTAASVTPGQL